MKVIVAEISKKAGADQLSEDALALDRVAFAEWWSIVDGQLHAWGAAERLWHRAFLLGMRVASGDATDPPGELSEFDPGPVHDRPWAKPAEAAS